MPALSALASPRSGPVAGVGPALLYPGAYAGGRAPAPRRAAAVAAVLLGLVGAGAASGLETDQFFAWGRHLEDMTEVLNVRVNLELERLVAELNGEGRERPCQEVRRRFFKRHRMLFFDRFETWAVNSPLVSRSPSGAEELREFRGMYIYGGSSSLFDTGRWMPPSPTVEVNGVRLGTDKLTHFLGTSWYYHVWYRRARARGLTRAAGELRTLRRGVRHEITVLGRAVSGVLSLGDLEANHEGMWFYEHLCAGEDPNIVHEEGVWRLRRPFDLRDHVTPEWDESYHPNIYMRRKWPKVKRQLLTYCPMLEHPQVRARRRAYRERDRVTKTEKMIEDMVAAAKLPDPSEFSIENVCREPAN